jgi:uncharacterized membrane protein YccC
MPEGFSDPPISGALGAPSVPPLKRRPRALPPYLVNGIAVAVGLGIVHLWALAVGSAGTAQLAGAGALYASLPHLVDRAGRAARRAFAGGVLGSATSVLVAALSPVPWALNLGIALFVFAAMLAMAWGARAGPLSFTVILAIVFSLGAPRNVALLHELGWTLAGASVYSALAYVSTLLLEPRYRTLAIASAVGTSARLLVSRAGVLETRGSVELEASRRWTQIDEETRLATELQAARDLVFAENEEPHSDHTELLLRATELRDLLLTSRLDLDLLGQDDVAHEIRQRVAVSLRTHAAALGDVESALTSGTTPPFDRERASRAVVRILDERGLPADDPRVRLLPAIASRQQRLVELIAELHRLRRWGRAENTTARSELEEHTGDERWPLSELTRSLSLKSPVFRHALRSSVAVAIAHAVSTALPWATHPHWLILSVAVVLRGTFAQTLSRRNDRIVGTAAGCLLALALATSLPAGLLVPILWLAAATAHAYVNVRYTLTAVAATVMALLQTRTLEPITASVVLERLADTVIGAGFAWAFSYVLPSWSRRALPALLEATLQALRAYAESAPSLRPEAPREQRLARERAYGSLEAFIASVRLSRVEPERVRPPLPLLLSFIDHAQSLMAHLSSLRLLLLRRAEQLRGPDTDETLETARKKLARRLQSDVEPHSISPRTQALELPSVPAERAAFPWLVRRLDIAIYEADVTGQTARRALAVLRERASLRPRD